MLANTKPLSPIDNNRGFTVVELLISITVIGIALTGLVGAMVFYFANMTRNNVFINMTIESQNLLRSTVEELRYGAGVRQSNTINDPNAPSEGWNTNNDEFVIVIAVPAKNSDNEFIIDPVTGQPYNNELVYFKDGGNLFKRTLANPSAENNSASTSCPTNIASTTCPADRLLAESVKDMVFSLFDQDNIPTTNPLLARSINITLKMERDTYGQPQSLDNSIRVTLRNNYE